MKVITESFLRGLFKKNIPEVFPIEDGQIVTPSAVQYLRENKVKLQKTEKSERKTSVLTANKVTNMEQTECTSVKPKYIDAANGGYYHIKPEHMTQLHSNVLVAKNHPKIVFRGKLDSLQSSILLLSYNANENNRKILFSDLNELLDQTREIMKADVLNKPLPEKKILGLSNQELRKRSHTPKKYFGIKHITPSAEMGKVLLELNLLRSSIREVEVAAVHA
ncbi:MAG: hypothetical protein B6I31_05175 [Desulfobacteraceae bacterium 4572_19]|nr:MAG: hypothetical protein B6I31_05175 [Desulfobacteraceae bacterium 4572_19]